MTILVCAVCHISYCRSEVLFLDATVHGDIAVSYCTHRTGHLQSVPTAWSGSFREGRCLICTWYDVVHVSGWELYILHDLAHVHWVWICTVQTLGELSQRQVRI